MDDAPRPRILIVDDTPTNITLLVQTLADEYEVRAAIHGDDALEAVAEETPDLILLDINMPGMDGHEVCRRLKADPGTQSIPIIFLTGRDEEEDELKGLSLGAVDYLTRPLSIPILRARLRTHLELKRSRDIIEWSLLETRKAKEEAERATRSKSEFLAMTSHEIRTPLGAMIGLSQLLLNGSLSGEQRTYATTIRNSGEALLGILNDILDFSKIEAGKLELDVHPFGCRALVDEVCLVMAERARQKCLELVSTVAGEIPECLEGDSGRLRQMLFNLLGNALKFTQQGSVGVHLDLVGQAGNMVRVRARVADTGIGLSPEAMGRLFHSFAQAHVTTTRKFGGTGLGLNITKRLAELMEGQVGVESQEGHGSTFWFELPLGCQDTAWTALPTSFKSWTKGAPQATVSPEPLADSVPKSPLPIWKGRWVLVADDNPANQLLARGVLTQLGLQVTAAFTGEEALERLREKDFDAILLDRNMPGMDGDEAARRIRSHQEATGRWAPLIGFTASQASEGLPYGVELEGLLTKPLRLGDLEPLLARVWEGRDPVRQAGEAAAVHEHLLRLGEVLGGREAVVDFVGEILVGSEPLLEGLRRALEQRDLETLSRCAHDLKSNSGNVGAMVLSGTFKALEKEALEGAPQARLEALGHEAEVGWQALAQVLRSEE